MTTPLSATELSPTARLVHKLAELIDRNPHRIGPRSGRVSERSKARFEDEDGDGVGRRGFLVRAAVVGAALVTNPLKFVLRPGTAYANVCGDGVGCGTGWTVFCCTVNGGANTCPPGSYAAGWWKADSSAFCGGAARYYIDCNRLPSQPGSCGCISCHSGNGSCDRRRYCCNVFRYGQCHLEIGGVTPVVCRVITCTPPWRWDPACSTSPRTDNRTGSHTAPCLPGPGASAITIKYQDLGMVGSPLGRQTSVEQDVGGGGRWAAFERGAIYWRRDLGAWGIWGPIHQAWIATYGGVAGIGYPRSDTRPAPGGGHQQDFERRSLFWSADTDVHAVQGGILDAYRRAGGPGGLGYPLADEEWAGQGGKRSRFQRGVVHWRQDLGAHATFGAILAKFEELGGSEGLPGLPWTDEQGAGGGRGAVQWFTGTAIFWSPATGAHEVREPVLGGYLSAKGPDGGMGFPVTDTEDLPDGGRVVRFERGTVTSRPDLGTFPVFGAIHERWQAIGGAESGGLPWSREFAVGDGRGRVQWFEGRGIYWAPQIGAFDVPEPLLSPYRSRGGPTGPLGYPVTGPEPVAGGGVRQRFERGTLTADAAGNVTEG